MNAGQTQQPEAVGRCKTCGELYPLHRLDMWLRCQICNEGWAAAAESRDARIERGTRSVQRVDGRAERTLDDQERVRWVVEWWLHRDAKWVREIECVFEAEATRTATQMFWNGFTTRVVEEVAVVRRRVVAEVPAGSPIDGTEGPTPANPRSGASKKPC